MEESKKAGKSVEFKAEAGWKGRSKLIILWTVLAIAFFLRIYHNDAGLPAPNLYGIDEDLVVERGMGIWLGLTPLLPWPGSIHMMLIALAGGLYFLASHFHQILLAMSGNLSDMVAVVNGFYIEFFREPTPYYLLGRCLQAAISTLSVYIVCRIGREADDDMGGIIAGGLLALAPLDVYMGHIVNVDGLMTMLMMASLLFAIRYWREGANKNLLTASLLGGISTAAKLNGLFCLIPLCVAIAGGRLKEKEAGGRSWAGAAAWPMAFFAVGFIVGCPYVLTNPPVMAKMLFNIAIRMFTGNVDNGWLYLLTRQLPYALGWSAMLLGWAGVATLIYRREGSLAPAIALMAAYFLFFGKSSTLYIRYAMPLLPLFCLSAGMALSLCFKALREKDYSMAIIPLIVALIFPMIEEGKKTADMERQFSLPDTRVVAGEWIEKNVPPGQAILVTGYGNPRLRQSVESLKKSREMYDLAGLMNEKFASYRQLLGSLGASGGVTDFLADDNNQMAFLSEGLLADKAFDRTKIRFLIADPNLPKPAYYLIFINTGVELERGDYIKKVRRREYDAVLIHTGEARAGAYMKLRRTAKMMAYEIKAFSPRRNEIRGPRLELFLIKRKGPAALRHPRKPPSPRR